MTRLGVIAVAMIGVVTAANAAPQCYHPTEIEADQAARYQAKLMVLSDSCRSNSYNQFVNRNAETIIFYQRQLISFFRRGDARRPEDQFDKFLTRLANQTALTAGQEPLDSLCPRSAEFLSQAVNFGKEEFRRFVASQAAVERKSYRICTQ